MESFTDPNLMVALSMSSLLMLSVILFVLETHNMFIRTYPETENESGSSPYISGKSSTM